VVIGRVGVEHHRGVWVSADIVAISLLCGDEIGNNG
jgi:hypothetical protein